MSSDGSPILIDLLDSLSSINRRLNLIETALSLQDVEDGLVGAGAGKIQAQSHLQPHWQPPAADKSPRAVARRYGQPPPPPPPPPPYQPYSQSITPPTLSIHPPPPTDYTHNAAAAASAGWPSTQHSHSGISISHAGTPAASKQQRPYTKRSSQLLRLQNMHVKDMASDDGTEYKVDASDGDVPMRHSEEADAHGADNMDIETAVKQESLVETQVFGQPPPVSDVAKQLQPGQSVPSASNPAPAPAPAPASAPAPPVAEEARLEALPEGFIVTGRATLQEELDGWTIPRGYSMRINGTRSHGRQQKIRMVCFRGGRSRLRPKEEEQEEERQQRKDKELLDKESERERDELLGRRGGRRRKPTTDRVSKKCECPFRFELVEVRPGADEYAVHYTNDDHTQHNHAAADLMLDPRARKLPSALKAEVDQWLCGSGSSSGSGNGDTDTATTKVWTIAAIQAELQKRGYGHVLDFDLRNRKRALLHKERLAQQNGGESSKAKSTGSMGESSAGNTPVS